MLQPAGDLVKGMQVQSMGLTGPPQSAADLVIDGNFPIKPCPVAVFVHAVVDTSIVSGTAISVLIPVCRVVGQDVEKKIPGGLEDQLARERAWSPAARAARISAAVT